MTNEQAFDGFWFLPNDDEGLKLSFFTFGEDLAGGTPIDSTELGDTYHLAFFKEDKAFFKIDCAFILTCDAFFNSFLTDIIYSLHF